MRRNSNKFLGTIFLSFLITSVFIYCKIQTGIHLFLNNHSEHFQKVEVNEFIRNKSANKPTESFLLSHQRNLSNKYVTKSLVELGKMDEISKNFIFLNSVPKCGSEILILLLQKLQGVNNFRHVRLKDGNKRKLSRLQQETLVYELFDIIRDEAVPLSFDRTVYFTNFSIFDKQSPTYVNLIRNPVDKVISRIPSVTKGGQKYNYFYKCLLNKKNNCNYKTGKPYDLTIPYFCGHNPRCMILNDKWALETAKSNVEKYYPVVGVLEELNVTLEVLETKIPYFFKGVQNTYHQNFLGLKNKKVKIDVPISIRNKLEETLIAEMEFYQWIKTRLFKQLQIMYGEHSPNH